MMFDVLLDFVSFHCFVNLTDVSPYLVPTIEKVVVYIIYLKKCLPLVLLETI